MTNPRNQSSSPSSEQLQQHEEYLDKYIVRSYLRPSHLNLHQSAQTDYGTFNQYKLDDLIDLQGDGFNEHKVIRLAFVENNSIHLEEEGVQLFQKYGKNEIAFVGLYGHSSAGKSLILDKIINLCELPGSYFASRNNHDKGIYLWSVPFTKANIKIFLLDIDGYANNQDMSYFMLLDLMLLLCSSILFVAQPDDYSFDQLSTIYKQIKKSRSHFRNADDKQDTFWPNTIYCLFRRSITITKGLESIIKMFNNFNFTIIDDAMDQRFVRELSRQELMTAELKKYGNHKKIISTEYIKRISGVIRDIMVKIDSKVYLNLRYTGANLIKLSVNAVQHLNLKNYLNIDKLFRKSMKELYYDAYNYHTQLYNETLIGYLSQQQPMQVDYLLKAFQACSQETLKSFNLLKVDQELKEQYSQKLERYIGEREKMVLEINKKKSRNKAKISVPEMPSQPEIKELTQFISIAKKAPKNYEQVYSEELMPQITSGLKSLEKKYKNDEKERQIREKSVEYKRKIQAKSKELEQLRKNKSQKQSQRSKVITLKSTFQKKQKSINEALKTLKSQCIQSKVAQSSQEKPLKNSKSAEMLRAEQQALRREREKKERILEDLKIEPPVKNIQLISKLESKISEKINQQRELENVLSSNMKVPTIHVLKSMTSVNSPRKVQSRAFNGANSNMRIITSPKT